MSRPRRAFSGLLSPGEPFDWPLFLRGLLYQPVPVWLVLSALMNPVSRLAPAVTRAVCVGRPRQAVVDGAVVAYTLFVPPLGTALLYLLFGRRRLVHPYHRRIGDVMFALMLVLSAADAWILLSRLSEQWETLRPGVNSLRALCWP